MLNPTVQAAGEAMINAGPSLSSAISSYREEWSEFLSSNPDSAKSAQPDLRPSTYKASMEALNKWDRAAETKLEAAMALRLALEDYESGDTPRIPAMIKAALGFLDNAPMPADKAAE